MTTLNVPVIDLRPFYFDDRNSQKRLAAEIDNVLQDIGFLVVTGHPIEPELTNGFFVDDRLLQPFGNLNQAPRYGAS